MTLHVDQPDDRPVAGGNRVKVSDLGSSHRLIQDGVEQLAHGAMICPSCRAPASVPEPVGVGLPISCGFCATTAPARNFLARDVFDTAGNEVVMVARMRSRGDGPASA